MLKSVKNSDWQQNKQTSGSLCGSPTPQGEKVFLSAGLHVLPGTARVLSRSRLENVIFHILNLAMNAKSGFGFEWTWHQCEQDCTLSGD